MPAHEVLTAYDVERDLTSTLARLEEATDTFSDLATDAAVKEANFRRDYARALVRATADPALTSAPSRAAHAESVCADAHRDYLIADALMRSQRELLATLRYRVDAIRTLSANVRIQT